jgi:hypothetical protein
MYVSQIWAATPYLQPQGKERDGQSPSEMAVGSVEKDVGGQRHHVFMVCGHARVWIGTRTVQSVLRGNAAVKFFD